MQISEQEIERAVKEVLKQRKFQLAAWDNVIGLARKYALMKFHGIYIGADGQAVRVSHGDRESHISMMTQNLLSAAEKAFLEDAMTGIAMDAR